MIRALILAIVLLLIGTTVAINNYIKTQNQISSSKRILQTNESGLSTCANRKFILYSRKILQDPQQIQIIPESNP